MPRVEIEGKIVEFPDDMELSDIEASIEPASSQIKQSRPNPLLDIAAKGVALSPLGMAASGAEGINKGLGLITTPFIKVPEKVQSGASALFRGARATGVGAAQGMIQPKTASGVSNILSRTKEAFQPNFKPRNIVEKAGAFVGENAPVVAATAASPLLAGPLAFMAQQAGETGKVSPVPLAASAGSKIVSSGAKGAYQDLGRRSLGYTKRFLKNEPMVNQANTTVETLLKEKKFPTGNPEDMVVQLSDTLESSGKAIGARLKKLGQEGNFTTVEELTAPLEGLRPRDRLTGRPLTGGQWDEINRKIDNAVDTIRGGRNPEYKSKPGTNAYALERMGNPPQISLSWEDANVTKGKLQELANYNSNKNATLLDKAIAGVFRETLDKSLERVSSAAGDLGGHVEFLKQKKIYGAASNAMDPVFNRLSSELGNKGISLTDWILGSGQIAAGNPLMALATVGAKKIIENKLPSIGTRAAYSINKLGPLTPSLVNTSNMRRRKDLRK